MSIRTIKFVNGEEVVAEVEQANDCYILKNPMRIAVIGEGQLGFIPYLIFSDEDEVEINERNVLYILTPSADIKNSYNVKFGSGIVLPTGAETSIITSRKN